MNTPDRPNAEEVARQEERWEIVNGLRHASQVCWRWANDPNAPWDRKTCADLGHRLALAATDLATLEREQRG